jgi:hypothetical protein
VEVAPGLSDGTLTEVQSESLKEGDEIVVGEMGPAQADGGETNTNPFVPQFMRSSRPR